ncbi:MAG: fumarylacetoacetase [Pseudonocardia sp.]|nr:fumarylacetoacetase [Pseudonocardia sp.]
MIEVPDDTLFGPANLPWGVFSRAGGPRRIGVALGEHVLDGANALREPLLAGPVLNPLLGAGRRTWTELRERLVALVTGPADALLPHLVPRADVALHLPVDVGDYVDFYASEHHATNVGKLFRPGSEPLTPNWKHLPIGYHGRSGTVVVSGTDVVRPCGQRAAEGGPVFGPSTRLDIEAEVAFVVGAGATGPVPVADVAGHVFGVCLLNDWSARDLQAWEYVPLGPFLGKSFATSVSPWIVPLDALAAAWVAPPARDVPLLPYLHDVDDRGLDLALEVALNGHVVSRPPFASTYWTVAQLLAHLTVNGASVRPGDLFASGTVSGPGRDERGSLLELSWGGAEPITLPDGSTRTFLDDGDEVTITATAPAADGGRLGFGSVRGRILPALS